MSAFGRLPELSSKVSTWPDLSCTTRNASNALTVHRQKVLATADKIDFVAQGPQVFAGQHLDFRVLVLDYSFDSEQ